MPLEPGTALGPYAVTAKIGEGGMGEVYRARDTKLDRDVALKVLPEAFTQDPDRLARFEREAKVLASLNHPNIAAIYGLEEAEGTRALVLELVEGTTLADRIKRGPIPLDEALPIAKQIAEALEAAHEAGVIHRDLKPANIKVREDGTVKVLDFGLAKAFDPSPVGDPSQSPTLTAAATQMGVIMGTAAYMSPEQAAGKQVDKRGDIWSFGVVLFEMLTGRRLFTGETVSHVLGGVLRIEPDWNTLPDATPQAVRRLLRRCLQKERKQRLHDVADVRLDLEEGTTSQPTDETAPNALPEAVWRQALPWVTGLILAAVTGVAVWALTGAPSVPPPRVTRSHIMLPSGAATMGTSVHNLIALSPDGTNLAYAGSDQLYLRAMDQLDAAPIRGTEGATEPFFSPDGQWIGFWADGRLQKVSAAGGLPVTLCETAEPYGASWSSDDTIFFTTLGVGISQLPGVGGTPEIVIPEEDDIALLRPQALPGGNGSCSAWAIKSRSNRWSPENGRC